MKLASLDDPIARAQAQRARAMLESREEKLAIVEIVFMRPEETVGRLAQALLEREADMAACPADLLPEPLPPGVVVAAVLRDKSERYCWVSRGRSRLGPLPSGSKVVVCDVVARAQILHRFPRLAVDLVQASGDVLDGLRSGRWTAGCLPAALLEAGSLAQLDYEPVPAEEIMPRVGQGVLAILLASGASKALGLVRPLDDPRLGALLGFEWAFLQHAPADAGTVRSARAVWSGGEILLTGMIAQQDGRWLVLDEASGPARFGAVVAQEVAESCGDLALQLGARSTDAESALSVAGVGPARRP